MKTGSTTCTSQGYGDNQTGGYGGQGGYGHGGYDRGYSRGGGGFRQPQKKCHICGRTGCWSTKHSKDEQQSVYNRYRQQGRYHTQELPSKEEYQAFLADVEGIEALEPLHEDGFSQHFADASYYNQQSENRQWYTEHYFIDPVKEEQKGETRESGDMGEWNGG
jgi:hypothetical protein